MAAAPATVAAPEELTLLDLVRAVSAESQSEAEVVATILHLVRTGRVRLRGNFRGSLLEDA